MIRRNEEKAGEKRRKIVVTRALRVTEEKRSVRCLNVNVNNLKVNANVTGFCLLWSECGVRIPRNEINSRKVRRRKRGGKNNIVD